MRGIRPDGRGQVSRIDHQPRVIFGIFEVDDMFVVLASQRRIARWIFGLLALTVAIAIAKLGAM